VTAGEGEVAGIGIRFRLAPPGLLERPDHSRRVEAALGDVDGGAELMVRGARRGAGPRTPVRVAADVPARRGLLRARAVALHHRDVPVALALRLSERLQRRLLQRDPLERLQRRRLGARIGGMNERIMAPREPDDARRRHDGHHDPGHDGPAADARANGMPSHEGSDPTERPTQSAMTPPGCHRIAIRGRRRSWSRCQPGLYVPLVTFGLGG